MEKTTGSIDLKSNQRRLCSNHSGDTRVASAEEATVANSSDGLLAMLLPVWQALIGCLVLVVVLAAVGRIFRRGPSRMATALIVVGFAVVGLVLLALVTACGWQGSAVQP